ncbi:MAG: acyltransferase [bacterium]|nr:acyltransferase [bacterium]
MHKEIALSEQQKKFQADEGGALTKYRIFIAGNKSWGFFAAFELYNLLISGCGSLLGYGARALLLPFFLGGSRGKITVGRGVTLRNPAAIFFGRGVIAEDYAVIDVRSTESGSGRIEIGDHVFLGRNTIVTAKGGEIKLHPGVNISSDCRIATQSSVEICSGVLIGAYTYIGPGNHRTNDSRPIMEQGMDIRGGVHIGENCWIGARVTILDGVKVGNNSVIGAHSLVREDVPENAVVAGTPARIIRYRS